jgi:hypothetical protein
LRVLGKAIAFKLVGFRAGLSFPSDFLWPTKKVRHNNANKESETQFANKESETQQCQQRKPPPKKKEKKESPTVMQLR